MKKKILVAFLLVAVVAAAYPLWKPAAKRVKWFVIFTNIGQDALRRAGIRDDQINQSSALARSESEITRDLDHIREVYGNYLAHSGLRPEDFAGKRVLELGPGLNVGVPLMFVADGAESAAGLDKFVPFQDAPYYRALYSRLRASLTPAQQARFDGAVSLDPSVSLKPARMKYVFGKDVTECVEEMGPASYDLILSNAVIEEIYDPKPVFAAQDRLLRPGGVMVHAIDLRDYGMFSKYGYHPLEFLTVPDWAYRLMVESSGQPNRQRVAYYRNLLREMRYEQRIFVTYILGVGRVRGDRQEPLVAGADYTDASLQMVKNIRPRLLSRYRDLPDADLLVTGILLVGRKPVNTALP